jgi:hypothetical protein
MPGTASAAAFPSILADAQHSRYCNHCGGALVGSYRVYRRRDGSSRLVLCEACAARAQPCAACGLPLVEPPHRLSDGRPLCAACRASAQDDPAAARLLYEQVIAIVEGQLGLRVHRRPGFGLYSRADMRLLEQTVQPPPPRPGAPALPGHLVGAYIKLGRRREIVVETGLPRLLMGKVIAHEYAHAWQGENCAFLADAQLSEGFCEWVAWKVLGALGAADVQQALADATGFYADALRRVLAIEASGGAAAVLARMRDPRAGMQQP